MTEILKLHPYYYGLHKAGEQVGINFTEGFSDYIDRNMRGQYHPQPKNLKIPEIYKKFQENSPLSIFKDYEIAEVDMMIPGPNNEKTDHYFYKNYVSQSLPVVLRNEANDWDVVQDLEKIETKGDLD